MPINLILDTHINNKSFIITKIKFDKSIEDGKSTSPNAISNLISNSLVANESDLKPNSGEANDKVDNREEKERFCGEIGRQLTAN